MKFTYIHYFGSIRVTDSAEEITKYIEHKIATEAFGPFDTNDDQQAINLTEEILRERGMLYGQKVHYIPYKGAPEETWQNGIVKSHINGESHVFVVYKCNDNWECYRMYAAQKTSIKDIKPGWKNEEANSI